MMRFLVMILLGGVGAVLRWLIEEASAALLPRSRLWATAGVNVLGSFLVGLAALHASSLVHGLVPSPRDYQFSTYLTVGFCGGFTTFSSALATPLSSWKSTDHPGRRTAAMVLVATPVAASLAFWLALSV